MQPVGMTERDRAAVRVHALGVRAAAPSPRRARPTRRPRSPRRRPCRRSSSPVCASTLRVRGIGPFSMVTGSTPTSVVATMRARGFRPSALRALAATRAAPPRRRRTPATTCPRCARRPARRPSAARASRARSRAGPRRARRVCVSPVGLPSASSTGAVDRDDLARRSGPPPTPAIASCWLRSPKRSVSSRVMPYSFAIISAPWNCDAKA